MREKGVAHAHFRLVGRGLVLRVPRLSQWALPPAENLAYQAACFRRAEPSGATPRLAAVLPVSDDLPRGALLVEEIVGRPPLLPQELPSLAAALARLHAVPLPAPAARPPLADHGASGPIAGTLAVIERQVPALDEADLPRATRDALLAELDWARATRRRRQHAASSRSPSSAPTRIPAISSSAPTAARCWSISRRRSTDRPPSISPIPASSPRRPGISTCRPCCPRSEIAGFYRRYLDLVGPSAAARLRPWLLPCRRLTWLRTMMWCARWRVASAASPDWSERRVDPALLSHIRRRVATFFMPETVATMRAEWLEGPLLEI